MIQRQADEESKHEQEAQIHPDAQPKQQRPNSKKQRAEEDEGQKTSSEEESSLVDPVPHRDSNRSLLITPSREQNVRDTCKIAFLTKQC